MKVKTGRPSLPASPAELTVALKQCFPQHRPAQKHEGGTVPEGLLTGEGWSRSLDPPPRSEPIDVLRAAEEEHLWELWADRGVLLEEQRRAVADGGCERSLACEIYQCSRCGTTSERVRPRPHSTAELGYPDNPLLCRDCDQEARR